MASDATNSVTYYLSTARERDVDLARIRHWAGLKVGYESHDFWVKGLDYAQISSVEIRSLLNKTIYYEKDGKLYLLNSLLPDRIVPALLWTPIERALKVSLPSYNHNFFGIDERISIKLVACALEIEPHAILVSLKALDAYIPSAPAVRLNMIRWVVLDNDQALLLGKPLLPIPGVAYWQRKDMLIPVGYDFEFYLLSDLIQKIVNPGRDAWIIWNTNATYQVIPKEALKTLSRSSFRLTKRESLNRKTA